MTKHCELYNTVLMWKFTTIFMVSQNRLMSTHSLFVCCVWGLELLIVQAISIRKATLKPFWVILLTLHSTNVHIFGPHFIHICQKGDVKYNQPTLLEQENNPDFKSFQFNVFIHKNRDLKNQKNTNGLIVFGRVTFIKDLKGCA